MSTTISTKIIQHSQKTTIPFKVGDNIEFKIKGINYLGTCIGMRQGQHPKIIVLCHYGGKYGIKMNFFLQSATDIKIVRSGAVKTKRAKIYNLYKQITKKI